MFALMHLLLGEARFGVAKLVEIHAVGLRTTLVFHEMRTVFRRAETRFDAPSVDGDVVDTLYGSKCIVVMHIGDIGRSRWTLHSRIRRAGIDDDFMNLSVFTEVFMLLQNLSVGKSRRQTNNEYQILLHYSHIG